MRPEDKVDYVTSCNGNIVESSVLTHAMITENSVGLIQIHNLGQNICRLFQVLVVSFHH